MKSIGALTRVGETGGRPSITLPPPSWEGEEHPKVALVEKRKRSLEAVNLSIRRGEQSRGATVKWLVSEGEVKEEKEILISTW